MLSYVIGVHDTPFFICFRLMNNFTHFKVIYNSRKALKRAHLQGVSFGLSEAFRYCASAAAFRYGGHLLVNDEMTIDEVIK